MTVKSSGDNVKYKVGFSLIDKDNDELLSQINLEEEHNKLPLNSNNKVDERLIKKLLVRSKIIKNKNGAFSEDNRSLYEFIEKLKYSRHYNKDIKIEMNLYPINEDKDNKDLPKVTGNVELIDFIKGLNGAGDYNTATFGYFIGANTGTALFNLLNWISKILPKDKIGLFEKARLESRERQYMEVDNDKE